MTTSIAIYLGYTNLNNHRYGSELALIKLVTHLKKWYNIYIISPYSKNPDNLGLTFITYEEYEKSTFDFLIISRYVNFYLYLPVRAPKVYLWMHDVCLQPFFNGIAFPENGRFLLENVICDGLVVQTHWHENIVKDFYPFAMTHIIGNGIDTDRFINKREKVPYSFIWTSSPSRGLTYLLEVFPEITKKYPQSTLNIFRGSEEFTQNQFDLIKKQSNVVYHGAVDNNTIAEEFLRSEVWLYPTDFSETYCISALEAQAAGCLCVCSNKAAIKEVVGDRGVLLYSSYATPEYFEEMMKGLETIFSKKEEYSKKAREWGLKQDWEGRALMWKKLLDIPVDKTKVSENKSNFNALYSGPSVDIRVINLERRPDRLDYIKKHLDGLNFRIFPAVDGKVLQMDEEIVKLFSNCGYLQKNPYPGHQWCKDVIGCALSHYRLWKEASSSDAPLAIFEDNVVKSDNFIQRFTSVMEYLHAHEKEWDLCFLGYLDDRPIYDDKEVTDLGEVKIHEFNSIPARKHGGGTHGYVINRKGAQKLLNLAEKYGIAQPVDWFIIEMSGVCVGSDTNTSYCSRTVPNIVEPFCVLKCFPHLVGHLGGDTDIQKDF